MTPSPRVPRSAVPGSFLLSSPFFAPGGSAGRSGPSTPGVEAGGEGGSCAWHVPGRDGRMMMGREKWGAFGVKGWSRLPLLGVLVLLTTGASHAGFLAPALLRGTSGMPRVSSGVISARGRTVALKPRRYQVMPCWFRALCVLVTEGWLLCGARGGLLERTGEGEWSPVPSRHPSEALLRAGKGAALETNAGGMSPLCTEARCPGRSRWSNAFREPSRSRPSTPAAGKRSPIDSALFVMDLF